MRRGTIPKNLNGEHYYWKDLNIGIDIELFGIVYHITDCDDFTRVSCPSLLKIKKFRSSLQTIRSIGFYASARNGTE